MCTRIEWMSIIKRDPNDVCTDILCTIVRSKMLAFNCLRTDEIFDEIQVKIAFFRVQSYRPTRICRVRISRSVRVRERRTDI